ncbi:hypothetical protein ANCDUO_02325 [Ancylostoma duodenale]|uniref:Uncharacterized protein n=1 Tax=Ancylostoma duodenale TaxID=51022 RepID=A0A0C2H736_9BILA|nr:hypothetical protein ANCDUO_02325 [Ancylostoma duodenale]
MHRIRIRSSWRCLKTPTAPVTKSQTIHRTNTSRIWKNMTSELHRGEEVTLSKCKSIYFRNLRGLYPECVEIGFTVQRNQPRVVVNLIVPVYCVTFMDAFIYVFGYGMQRAYLLPVYATFFTDISSIYTIRQLPHIARWFFARLFSTSACLIALLFTKELARCSRRFIAIVVTTAVFYGIFSIPYDIFRSS